MPTLRKSSDAPLEEKGTIVIPARLLPSFRVCLAGERGVRNNILIRMHGGIGDIVCAEPSVRYALNHFKEAKFSLATQYPELFRHLKFEKVYDLTNVDELNSLGLESFLMYENTDTSNELAAEFVCHTLMHGIDYASLYMWRMILNNKDKEIQLVPNEEETLFAAETLNPSTDVVIHAGKTWPSRTMPLKWWNSIISDLINNGLRPVLIGGSVDNGRASYLDVNAGGCLDFRSKLSFMHTVALLQRAKVLISNDSSPVHMATTGDAWIGFMSTVKHPDHIKTWRKGVFGWRMEDLSRGGIYQDLDVCPNKDKPIRVDGVDILDMLKWCPEPKTVVDWVLDKIKS